MVASFSFKISVTAFDGLRAIIERDKLSSAAQAVQVQKMDASPEKMRAVHELEKEAFQHDTVCRALGI
jgi:hypothetical protein